jgi:aspartate kinase
MKVLKFGGTSVGSAERMKEVARLINITEKQTSLPARQIIVLSAMSGTTNSLVQIAEALYSKKNTKANQLINQLEKKTK